MGAPVYTFQRSRRKPAQKQSVQNDIEYYTSIEDMPESTDWSQYSFFLSLVTLVLFLLAAVSVYYKGVPVRLRA